MRGITREDLEKLYPATDEFTEKFKLSHAVLENFTCDQCGEPVVIRQDPKSFDAEVKCLNTDCDNTEVLR